MKLWNNWFIVAEGEFEASKEVTISKQTRGKDEILKEFVKSSSNNSITRFQKEKLQNLNSYINPLISIKIESSNKKSGFIESEEKNLKDYQSNNSTNILTQAKYDSIYSMHDKAKANDIQFISNSCFQ